MSSIGLRQADHNDDEIKEYNLGYYRFNLCIRSINLGTLSSSQSIYVQPLSIGLLSVMRGLGSLLPCETSANWEIHMDH